MQLLNLDQVRIEDLFDLSVDGMIAGLRGKPDRCMFLNLLRDVPSMRRVALQPAIRWFLDIHDNDLQFGNMGYELYQVDAADSQIAGLFQDILGGAQANASLIIDYSCMPPSWFSSVLSLLSTNDSGPEAQDSPGSTLANSGDCLEHLDLDFAYAPAGFSSPQRGHPSRVDRTHRRPLATSAPWTRNGAGTRSGQMGEPGARSSGKPGTLE